MRGLGYPRRMHLSCPARGTWIEMQRSMEMGLMEIKVVPRKGHVD